MSAKIKNSSMRDALKTAGVAVQKRLVGFYVVRMEDDGTRTVNHVGVFNASDPKENHAVLDRCGSCLAEGWTVEFVQFKSRADLDSFQGLIKKFRSAPRAA